MKMPVSKPGGARFRGPTSSSEYNRNEDDKYLDLLELFKQSNQNEADLNDANNVMVSQHFALLNYIELLESRIEALENELKAFQSPNGFYSKTSFVDQMLIHYPDPDQDNNITENRSTIDLAYRHATLPIVHQIPKTHALNENGEVVIPNELSITITRTNTKGTIIENDIRNAFNGNNHSYWRREVHYSFAEAPDEEDVIIEIDLPLKMVNNPNVNTIQIDPHPELGIIIKNIEVRTNNAWEQIPGFEQVTLSSLSPDRFSPRRKWYFPNKPIQSVRITLVQTIPIQKNNEHIFVLGAQEIGIYLTEFNRDGSFILTPFDMSEVGVYSIQSVEHLFLNRNAFSYPENLDALLEHHIYDYEILVEHNGMLVPIANADWSNQTAPTLWVKTNLYPDDNNGVNPCLYAVRLNYIQS